MDHNPKDMSRTILLPCANLCPYHEQERNTQSVKEVISFYLSVITCKSGSKIPVKYNTIYFGPRIVLYKFIAIIIGLDSPVVLDLT